MKKTKKCLLFFVVLTTILVNLLLLISVFVMISFDYEISNDKRENYYDENDFSEIAHNRDWYLYKINDEYFISVNYDENFEIKKVNSKYVKNYSDMDDYSYVIFKGENPLASYYLIKDDKVYIKSDEINKCINLTTEQISDFDERIEGNWNTFQ